MADPTALLAALGDVLVRDRRLEVEVPETSVRVVADGGGVDALLEEAVKFLVVWKLVYRTREFKQVYDGILFCTASALGFAIVENLVYVLTSGSEAAAVALVRALTAVPSHIADGVWMGYGLGRARAVRGKRKEKEWLVLGFGGAVVLHGAYDFFLMFDSAVRLCFWGVMVGGWIAAFKVLKKALESSPFMPCSICCRPVPRTAAFCPLCRAEQTVHLTCNHCRKPVGKWARRCGHCYTRVRFPWHLQIHRIPELYPDHRLVTCVACDQIAPSGMMFCLHCGARSEGA